MTTEKLQSRQREFARVMALGKVSAEQAAIQVGYSPSYARARAHELSAHVGINKAIEQYRHEYGVAAQEHAVTPDSIMRHATEIAAQRENLGAAVAALRLQADVLGMLNGGTRDMPDAAKQLLNALGEGLARGAQNHETVTVHEVEARVTEDPGTP